MSSPYSVVEVKEFKLAAESEAPSDSPAADDEWGRDIVDLSEPTAVPSGQLFHPLIAKVNQALLGMNTFGTGDRSDVGGVGYRLWPTYTGICFALISAPLFYCLGLAWPAAGVTSVFMFVPMMIGSNTDELNAMASRILGHRIKRLLRKKRAS